MGNKGFTLIEILISIAILGILSAVTVHVINPQQRISQARDSDRKSAFRQLATHLELYTIDHGKYPGPCGPNHPPAGGDPPACDSAHDGDQWVPDLKTKKYMKTIPLDPINNGYGSPFGEHHAYFYLSYDDATKGAEAGKYFIIGTWLEGTNDPLTLGSIENSTGARPHWPNCTTPIDFADDIMIIRSYKCDNDPSGSL